MPQFFTPQFKERIRVVGAAVTMLAGALPFVGGLLAMDLLGDEPRGPLAATITLLSFLLGGALPWLSQSYMALAGNSGLRSRLRRHLQAGGNLPEADAFVGFSPGEQLHIWHGETNRDVGFLTIAADALEYRGDDFTWRLPRDMVDHLDLTPVEAGMQRILVRWHVPREGPRCFSLESRDATHLAAARDATRDLHRRLREWYRVGASQHPTGAPDPQSDTSPATLETSASVAGPLGFPPTDLSGAQIIEEPPSGSCVSIAALGVIIILSIWRVSSVFFESGRYYEGILWAGLISVLGALATGYLLHYLQAWEARQGRQKLKAR